MVQFEQLGEALCSAFDRSGLEQMVQFRLGRRLFDDVPSTDSLKTIAFNLIKLAEREGITEALIRGMYVSRPQNPQVVAYVTQHCPPAMTPLESAREIGNVTAGVRALIGLIQQFANPDIRLIIGRFGAEFNVTREKVVSLGKYKSLHDRLHQLSVKYLVCMVDAAKLWREYDSQREILESYASQLQGDAARANVTAQGLPNYRVEKDWINSLDEAAGLVLQGLNGNEDIPIGRGVETLRSVLRVEPTRINSLLCLTAGDLRLQKLVVALREIQGYLRQRPTNGVTAPAALDAALASLSFLQPRLAGLVEEHSEWQWLAKQFDAADTLRGGSLAERFPRWSDVRSQILALCELNPARPWAQQLKDSLSELENAAAPEDALQFGRSYGKFRNVARERFFNVDAELNQLSSQLVEIADPLNNLMEIVTHGG